jgi:hypothetical protein
MGIAVPIEYARVIKKVAAFILLDAASVMTEAMIGPTQGVQTRPRLMPIASPPVNPVSPCVLGVNRASLLNSCSIYNCTRGIRRLIPNSKTMITENVRRKSAETPVSLTKVERKRVKNVKLMIKPVTIPKGLFFPVPTEPDRTMGRIGSMHGDRIVTTPAINENKIKKIIKVDESFYYNTPINYSLC